MKSYQLLNTRIVPASEGKVSQVAEQLLEMGFIIVSGQFGSNPTLTVLPGEATLQLESVCTGQRHDGGKLYRTYSAALDGVRIVWHKAFTRSMKLTFIKGARND